MWIFWLLIVGYVGVGTLLTGYALLYAVRVREPLLQKPRWQLLLLTVLGILSWPYVCWVVLWEEIEEIQRERARRQWGREGTPTVGSSAVSPEQELLNKIPPFPGETRAVYRCTSCGRIYGRRYIPGALGEGATYNPCLCVATGQRVGAREVLSVVD